jgi:predicted molibdopterin-dependent oxidoreductase YjgC
MIREHQNEYLKIRRACNFHNAKVYSISPYAVRTADIAQLQMVYKPGTDEAVINGICLAAIEKNLVDSAQAKGLKEKLIPNNLNEAAKLSGVDVDSYTEMARALANGRKITFIAGEIVAKSLGRDNIGAALCNLNKLFGIENKGQIAVLARYANSKGAEKLGLAAEPTQAVKKHLQNLWDYQSESTSHNTDAMIALMKKEEIKGFIAVGVNPIRLYPDREFAADGLERVDFMVACDLFETETTGLADVVLPLCSWAEYDGEYVNLEGRVQNSKRALKPIEESKPAFEILDSIAEVFGKKLFQSHEERNKEINGLLKLDSSQPWPNDYLEVKAASAEIEKEFPYPLFTGDDAHHSGHLTERSQSLLDFCSEPYLELSEGLAQELDIDDRESVKVESPVGKIIVPARISEHLTGDAVFIPRNFSSTTTTALLMRKKRVDSVKITKLEE